MLCSLSFAEEMVQNAVNKENDPSKKLELETTSNDRKAGSDKNESIEK